MRIIILITRATFSSEGPLNYSIRLAKLLLGFGINTKIIVETNNFLILMRLLKHIIEGDAIIIPFVKGIELISILIGIPFAIVRRTKIIIVNHDVHGIYYARGLLWRLLIVLRSGKLLCLPFTPIINIYVSRYSKFSSLCISGCDKVLRFSLVIYPITREEIYKELHAPSSLSKNIKILVFSKISKMLDKDFWHVLGRCLQNIKIPGYNIELTIMGKGSAEDIHNLMNILRQSIDERCLRCTILKFNVPNNERDNVLKDAHIMIYPPSTEGLGMPVFEAVMNGIPILSARQTALIEFIKQEIYPHREVRYPDFCEGLMKIINRYVEARLDTEELRRIIVITTLKNLKEFLKVLYHES